MPYYPKIQATVFILILLAVGGLTVFVFSPYLYPIIFALVLAVVVEPLYQLVAKPFKKHRGVPAIITVLVVLVVFLIPFVFLGFSLIKELTEVYSSVIQNNFVFDLLNRAQAFLARIAPNVNINLAAEFSQSSRGVLTFLLEHTVTFFSDLVGVLFGFFITLFALYYLLKDNKKLKDAVVGLSPLNDRYDMQIMKKLSLAVNSVIRGAIFIALIQGSLAALGYWIFGVPNPVIVGAMTTLAALIPAVGTVLVTIPSVIYLLVTGHYFAGLGLLIWSLFFVALVDNFIRQKLIERDIKIHPFLIFISVLGGIGVFGPFGFILGPLILSLFFALLDIYQEEFQDYINSEK
jgi:predicted PurR-regulated permease PerM